MQRTNRAVGGAELSAGSAAEAGEGSGHADRADVPADAGRRATLSQKPRRGLLPGAAARTTKLGAERATDAHQQGRRSLSAHAAGAGSAPHSRSVWRGQRPAALGFEAGRTWWQEREEASHHCRRTKVSCLAASFVGEWRSLRTTAQQ